MTGSPFQLFSLTLVGVGIALLLLAARLTGQLLRNIQTSRYARTWALLRALMLAFAVGYLAFAALILYGATELLAATTGLILVGGGFFVYVVTRSSYSSLILLKEETLARSHVSDLLAALSDGLLLLDTDGVILSVNRRMCELTGRDEAEFVGSSTLDVIGLPANAGGKSSRLREGTLRRRQGPPLPVEVRIVEVASSDGQARSRLMIVRDRSEVVRGQLQLSRALRSAEVELRARHEQSSVLLAEFKPQLDALRGDLAGAASTAGALRRLDDLDAILAGVADAERRQVEHMQPFELAAVLRRATTDIERSAPGLTVSWVCADELPRTCEGQERAVHDIIVSVALFVHAELTPDSVRIAVEGVPGDDAQLLFIVRGVCKGADCLPPSSARIDVGLAAARLLCGALGGKLWTNADSGNLEVLFTIALRPAGERTKTMTPPESSPLMMVAAMASRSAQASMIAASLSEGSALVVDDSSMAREVISRLVRSLGYRVDTAASGDECLAKATARTYDLILLDLVLPDISGIELLGKLREHETSASTPIIVVSAIEETKSIAACLEQGADDYITKPVNPVILRARHHVIHENRMLARQASRQVARLEDEIRRSDSLLRAILPEPVARELQSSGRVRARRYPEVVVLFADIVGFTRYCEGRAPEEVLVPLQLLVKRFERLCRKHGVLKIKTVGDALIACGGLLDSAADASRRCVDLGFALVDELVEHPEGWTLRIGIHRGPVVAGIIGDSQFSYDIWGDTVNTAQRIEHHGVAGEVCVSAAVRGALPADYPTRSLGFREMKGKGDVEVFVVSPPSAVTGEREGRAVRSVA